MAIDIFIFVIAIIFLYSNKVKKLRARAGVELSKTTGRRIDCFGGLLPLIVSPHSLVTMLITGKICS